MPILRRTQGRRNDRLEGLGTTGTVPVILPHNAGRGGYNVGFERSPTLKETSPQFDTKMSLPEDERAGHASFTSVVDFSLVPAILQLAEAEVECQIYLLNIHQTADA